MNTSHFNCLRLSKTQKPVTWLFSAYKNRIRETKSHRVKRHRRLIYWSPTLRMSVELENISVRVCLILQMISNYVKWRLWSESLTNQMPDHDKKFLYWYTLTMVWSCNWLDNIFLIEHFNSTSKTKIAKNQ